MMTDTNRSDGMAAVELARATSLKRNSVRGITYMPVNLENFDANKIAAATRHMSHIAPSFRVIDDHVVFTDEDALVVFIFIVGAHGEQ